MTSRWIEVAATFSGVVPAKAGTHNRGEWFCEGWSSSSFLTATPCGYGSRIGARSARLSETTASLLIQFSNSHKPSRGAISPGLCNLVVPPGSEGAGKARRRLRPQHRVQWVDKDAHGFDRYSRDIPAFPAQWFTAYTRSPRGSGLSCPRCRRETRQRSARVAAPGPHDFAVRCSVFVRAACTALTPQRPSHLRPTHRDDRETSPARAETAQVMHLTVDSVKQNIFHYTA